MDDHPFVFAAARSGNKLLLRRGGVESATLRLGGGRRDGESRTGRRVDFRLVMGL